MMDPTGMTSSTEVLGAKAGEISLIGGGRFDYDGRQGREPYSRSRDTIQRIPIVMEHNPEQNPSRFDSHCS